MSKSHEILKEDIDELLRTRIDIERAVDEAIAKEFKVKSLTLNGLQIINREVIIHYLRQLLTIDRRLAPFTIVGLEKDVKQVIEIAGSTPIKTTIGGRIDRLDCINDEHGQRIRVIDYKTGGKKLKALADVNAIFDESQLSNHSDYYLQTFVYADIVSQTATEPVSPALLFIQHAAGENYDPTLCFGANQIVDIKTYRNDFNRLLMEKLQEIFNADIAFVPTADRGRCTNCAFKQLRGLVKE
jgi:ATP-dependent exoDNAse (exonuclease V) beta subunit